MLNPADVPSIAPFGHVTYDYFRKLGMNAATLLPLLATLLPTLIDQLTPNGKVPEEGVGNQNDLLASLSGLLQK